MGLHFLKKREGGVEGRREKWVPVLKIEGV